jgi:hypothetical protein
MFNSLLRPPGSLAARTAEKRPDDGPQGSRQEGRREFLRRATALTLTVPGLGAALVGSDPSPTANARRHAGRDAEPSAAGALATAARR